MNAAPRSGTATPSKGSEGTVFDDREQVKDKQPASATVSSVSVMDDLPGEVKAKLRKLERLETRYEEVMRNYRIAHARAKSIAPFEKALKENTPLTSIQEPEALLEYLNQQSLSRDMVMDELKRVTAEKDEYKKKYEQANKLKSEALEQVKMLKAAEKAPETNDDKVEVKDAATTPKSPEPAQAPEAAKSPIASALGIFSPKQKAQEDDKKAGSSDFFSYEDELPQLKAQVEEKDIEIEDLKSSISTLETDLKAFKDTNEALSTTVQDLEKQLSEASAGSSEEVVKLQMQYAAKVAELEKLKQGMEEQRQTLETLVAARDAEIERLRGALETKNSELVAKHGELTQAQNDKIAELAAQAETYEARIKEKFDAKTTKDYKDLGDRFEEMHDKIKDLQEEINDLKEAEVKYQERIKELEEAAEEQEQVFKNEQETRSSFELEAKRAVDDLNKANAHVVLMGQQLDKKETELKKLQMDLAKPKENPEVKASDVSAEDGAAGAPQPAPTSGGKKKNNKKKKGKGANATAATAVTTEPTQPQPSAEPKSTPVIDDNAARIAELEAEIAALKEEMTKRDASIDRLVATKQTYEGMEEKLKEAQENILEIGQEHVEAKEMIKTLQEEKAAMRLREEELLKEVAKLESRIEDLKEKTSTQEAQIKSWEESQGNDVKTKEELTNLRAQYDALKDKLNSTLKAKDDLAALTTQHEALKTKLSTLQTDLSAAEKLASTRYKELSDLQKVLQQAQPELKSLRTENATLRETKEKLKQTSQELKRLEIKEKTFKEDMTAFKKRSAEQDTELRDLKSKIEQETNARVKAEDTARVSARDLRRAESEKVELLDRKKDAESECRRLTTELSKATAQVKELSDKVTSLTKQNRDYEFAIKQKDEYFNSSQALVTGLRDQTSELGVQLREARSHVEAIEEELAETQRLLSERSREGETMRRLLNDVDERSEAKVREMKERMEQAMEERDRAEDEAATNGRKRAREVEEHKNRIRELERELKQAIEDRDELARAEKKLKQRREEIEAEAERGKAEVSEARAAMAELREALDASERQIRDAESQRQNLKKLLEESRVKYDKIQKLLKQKEAKLAEQGSSTPLQGRGSVDRGSRVASPSRSGSANGTNGTMPMADYVYLKTVLLQFFEQRDRKLQQQLVPVLGKLLHFDP
jgi:chromosome segregation ATPase